MKCKIFVALAGTDDSRLNQALLFVDRKNKAIQDIRDLLAKPDGEDVTLQIKQKVTEIFNCLNNLELIIGGKMAGKLHKEVERLKEQWIYIEQSSDVFHLELKSVPMLWEVWLTNASTLRMSFDDKRKWDIHGKVNPATGDFEGNFSKEDR